MSGPRLGRQQLARLEGGLSERDRAILRTVADCKLASAIQLQDLHFGTSRHANVLTSARTCRRVLERLTRDRLLTRLARRVGGIRAGSASYVYGLGPRGQRVLDPEGTRRRVSEPSALFVAHTLAIVDVLVLLRQAESEGQVEVMEVQTEPACWRHFSGLGGSRQVLRPDLFVSIGDGDYEHRWFIEVDLGTEHAPAIRRKGQTYLDYQRSGREQADHQVFPRVLWVTPENSRARQLSGVLAGLRADPALFAVTVSDEVLDALLGGAS